MDLKAFAQMVLDLAEQGLICNPEHGHAERLAQLIQTVEAIKAQAVPQIEAPTPGKA
jgi:hypothetical protein